MHHRNLIDFLTHPSLLLRFSLQVLIKLLKPNTSLRTHPKPPKRRSQRPLELLAVRERSASGRGFASFEAEEVVAVEEQGDCAAPHELFLGVFLWMCQWEGTLDMGR
jgi:hypothetical protein